MESVKIKQRKNKLEQKNGDLIFDQNNLIDSYVCDKLESNFQMFPLQFVHSLDPFTTLYKMKIDITPLLGSKYNCIYNRKNEYYGIVPIGIQTNESQKYRNGEYSLRSYDFVFNLKFQKQYILEFLQKIDAGTCAFLGSGYTFYIFPSDGEIKVVNVKLKLSNGDFIIAKTFECHNK